MHLLRLALACCLAAAAFGGEPATAATPRPVDPAALEDACWAIVLQGVIKDDGPLNIYAMRRDGAWSLGVGSTGSKGGGRWNTAKHVADLSAVKLGADGAWTGTIGIDLVPDSWVPKDRKPRRADVEVSFRAGPPPAADANALASISGTWRRGPIAGEPDGSYKPEASQGSIGGAIGPADVPDAADATFGLRLNGFLPGGRTIDGERRMLLSLGHRDGAGISAHTAFLDAHHWVYGEEPAPRPRELRADRISASGRTSFPLFTLDGEMVDADVTFTAGRVQNMLIGRWKATFTPQAGGGASTTAEGFLEGSTTPGARADRYVPDARPWFTPVPGWTAPAAGEHPRLFFRASDVPALRQRAETPAGKQLVARLRKLLNGGDGASMPTSFNPAKHAYSNNKFKAVDGTYTITHAAGFGFLYQLTGERKYADLARQCVELAWQGQRSGDDRYAWKFPNGQLRAGPTLGWYAVAYDLCYDAWPEDFRTRMAQAIIAYDEQANPVGGEEAQNMAEALKAGGEPADEAADVEGISLRRLLLSPSQGPGSNHFGPIIGGASLAVMAVMGDPGVDPETVARYLRAIDIQVPRALSSGFGDGGYFNEGHGPGQIASDTAFIPAVQAMRNALGRDYRAPRRNLDFVTMLRVYELIGSPAVYPYRSSMGGTYGGPDFSRWRDGLSRGGQFAQGFGAISDAYKPALLWTFETLVEPDPAARTYDTTSPYPHRPMLALINWPFDLKAGNPAEVLPKVHRDARYDYVVFRNRWQDADDTVVTMLGLPPMKTNPRAVMAWGRGMRLSMAECSGGIRSLTAGADGSGVVEVGGKAARTLAVDFSGASGAETLVVLGPVPEAKPAKPDGKAKPDPRQALSLVTVDGATWQVLAIVPAGTPPAPAVDGAAIVVGKQRFDTAARAWAVFTPGK